MQMEAEVTDAIPLIAGFLAKAQKGTTLAVERRKINDEIWLPFRAEARINGRLLLLKGMNIRDVVEYPTTGSSLWIPIWNLGNPGISGDLTRMPSVSVF
jgi:hypothetical protein